MSCSDAFHLSTWGKCHIVSLCSREGRHLYRQSLENLALKPSKWKSGTTGQRKDICFFFLESELSLQGQSFLFHCIKSFTSVSINFKPWLFIPLPASLPVCESGLCVETQMVTSDFVKKKQKKQNVSKKKGEKKVVVLAWVASLMCCVWCAIMCEDVRVSSGHLSGLKSATPPQLLPDVPSLHYSATVWCSSETNQHILLYLSLLSDKRPVLWGQLVLVFCTLLADLNALASMAVSLQSSTGFDFAPGLQPISHHPFPLYLLKLTESTGGTHTQKHTNSCKSPLIFSLPVPAWANFSWVAAKIKAFIHPWLWEVKRGAGPSDVGWSATGTLVWGVIVSCQPLVSVLF